MGEQAQRAWNQVYTDSTAPNRLFLENLQNGFAKYNLADELVMDEKKN